MICGIVCLKCGKTLPPHSEEEHLDASNPIHLCPHTVETRVEIDNVENDEKQMYKEIAKEIIEEYLIDNYARIYHLPIEMIDGVMVDVSLRVFHYPKSTSNVIELFLDIHFKYIADDYDMSIKMGSSKKLSIDIVANLVKEAINKIHTLSFDKTQTIFTDKPKKHNNEYLMNLLCKNDKIKCSINKCSVCYDATNTHTGCNHSLCLVCYGEMFKRVIDEAIEDDEDNKTIDCPICRKTIEMYGLTYRR